MNQVTFHNHTGEFTMNSPEQTSYLYFPLASETGLKSSITPSLGGDAKLNQDSFLLEPVSAENLHSNLSTRNFWCVIDQKSVYSVSGLSPEQEIDKFSEEGEETCLHAGFMWHTLVRKSKKLKLTSTVTTFVPVNNNVEIMHVVIRNDSDTAKELTSYAAIPIYGRSADNLRDHRHVTSLLHRIKTTSYGVTVCPTMSFDERGHQRNFRSYYTAGFMGDGTAPVSFFPTVEEFLGEGGTYHHPRAVYENYTGQPSGYTAEGKEAMGAFKFSSITLSPGEAIDYIVLLGAEDSEERMDAVVNSYATIEQIQTALEATKKYWDEKVNVSFHTGDDRFDNYMKWVAFQPFLRRLFGCSFLPHHDYGRGGRGWRDLWQDCLSLLLMDPANVGEMIEKNYGGVRIDGTNATIIGEGDGNFIADRNGISRVWMDHALWPLMTTRLYIDQTGDIDILMKEAPYFKDSQSSRGTSIDTLWNDTYGNCQKTDSDQVYNGSILEHLLIQQLTTFYEVGDHNIYRLRGADWNDALDMAAENGESVAFTCAYAGNLRDLASMLLLLAKKHPDKKVNLLEEIQLLLAPSESCFEDISEKHRILKKYEDACAHNISGKLVEVSLEELAENLTKKAQWLTSFLQDQEWIEGEDQEGWFNSYYDNHGCAVEGFYPDHVRMMLTGQVFAIMGNVATKEQISRIVKSADHYLYDGTKGGYRLNTDFHELKFDMGRMFGFAYGEKENGAVFSHMSVMYANALYRRGFAREGWKSLKALSDTALNFNTSRIYPGIPEYFRKDGRGMYHYLTGAASWYLMTMITEVFGVCGQTGDLILQPKLLVEQFDKNHTATVNVVFADKKLTVTYKNESGKDYGDYRVTKASCGHADFQAAENGCVVIPRDFLSSHSEDELHMIVELK